MAYTPKEWKDLPDETTPIQASDLNHIEQGIGDLSTKVDTLNTNVGDLSTLNTTEKSNLVGAINEVYQNNEYSTEEKIVGKWIDGKPIYRKVVTANSYSEILNTGISNLETMIKMEVLVSESSNGDWRNLPWLFNKGNVIGDQSWAGGFFYKMDTNQLNFQLGNLLKNIKKIVAILEYTKTTD